MIYKIIGWSRDAVGNVVKYHLKDICNTLTSFSGGVNSRIQRPTSVTPPLTS